MNRYGNEDHRSGGQVGRVDQDVVLAPVVSPVRQAPVQGDEVLADVLVEPLCLRKKFRSQGKMD